MKDDDTPLRVSSPELAQLMPALLARRACRRCGAPLPQRHGAGDDDACWATIAQILVTDDDQLVLDADALCITCGEDLLVFLDGVDPVEPPAITFKKTYQTPETIIPADTKPGPPAPFVRIFVKHGERAFVTSLPDPDRESWSDGRALLRTAVDRYNEWVKPPECQLPFLNTPITDDELPHATVVVVGYGQLLSFEDHVALDYYRAALGLDETNHETLFPGPM